MGQGPGGVTMDDTQLLIGQLQGRVAALEESNRQQTIIMRDMALQLGEINKTLSTATGGWRTMLAVGGASATVGGLLVAILNLLRGG